MDALMREAPLASALSSDSWAPKTILTPIPPTVLMVSSGLHLRRVDDNLRSNDLKLVSSSALPIPITRVC